MIKLLDIPENITYYLSNVKLILVTNNYFLEINEVIKGLRYQRCWTRHAVGVVNIVFHLLTSLES